MGPRSWLSLSIVLVTTVLVACSSPGQAFAYKDLKVSSGPGISTLQPAVDQDVTFSFVLRNTWNQPLTGVAWELRETGTTPGLVASGTSDIAAFGSSSQSHVLAGPLPKGTHTYEVVIDPANTVAEQDEGNNTSGTLTVVVADQDIAFSGPAVVTPGSAPSPPPSGQPFTIAFTLTNTLNANAASPGGAITVPYEITDSSDTVVTPTNPVPPLTVSVPGGTTGSPGTATVTVTMPATGSAGRFIYTITLWPANDSAGDDGNLGNNTLTVTVDIPASS